MSRTWIDPDGSRHRYAIFVPYGMTDGDRPPITLYLNGLGKNGDDGLAPLRDGLAPVIWEQKETFPFVVVFPQCGKHESWDASGKAAQRALAILDSVAVEYHTDPDRVFLTGLSSGGWGVWSIAARYPRRFAAIVPVSAGSAPSEASEKIAAANLPVWSFWISGDSPRLVEFNRQMRQALLERGASPFGTELDGSVDGRLNTHNAWDYAFRNPALLDWLAEQRRSRNDEPLARFDLLNLDEGLSELRAAGAGQWNSASGTELTYTGDDSAAPAFLSLPWHADDFELHLEFRSERPAAWSITCAPERSADSAADWDLRVVAEPYAGGGLFGGDGACVKSSDPTAELSLRPGEWNDLRLTAVGGRISAKLNGWILLDAVRAPATSPDSLLTLSVAEGAAALRWRNLRFRRLRSPRGSGALYEHVGTSEPERPEVEVSVERILEAWQARRDSTEAAKVVWRLDRRGNGRYGGFRAGIAPEGLPSTDELCSLTSNGSRYRYESGWWYGGARISPAGRVARSDPHESFQAQLESYFEDPTAQRCDPLRLVWEHDGSESCAVVTGDRMPQPLAVVSSEAGRGAEELDDLERVWLRGAMLACHPLDEAELRAERSRIVADGVWVNGTRCVVLEEEIRPQDAEIVRTFWVDPAKGFAIVRFTTRRNGALTEQYDLRYKQQNAGTWVPASWSVMCRRAYDPTERIFPGREWLFESASAKLVEYMSPGKTLAPRVETVPAATLVLDRDSREWSIAAPDGGRQPISSQDALRLQLVDSSDPTSSRSTVRVATAAAVLLLLGLLLYRRRQLRAEKRSGRLRPS